MAADAVRLGRRAGRRAPIEREGLAVLGVLVALVILFSILSPYFLTVENVRNVLVQSVFVLIVALGMTFVLLTGGIDLSVGSIMGLSGGIAALLMVHSVPVVLAIVGGIAVGALIGAVNGLLVTRLGITDFIVTLATLGIVRGILQLITAREPLRDFDSSFFAWLTDGRVLGIPVPVLLAVALALIASFALRKTAFGRRVFAVGISSDAAHLAGVPVVRTRMAVYVLSGMLAAVAGILLASRLSSVQPALGSGYELTAIAAAVIGGTSLAGGRGRISGTVVGALLLAILENGLRLLEVNAFWFQIVTGLIILVAVAMEHLVRRRGSLRRPRPQHQGA